MCGLRCQAELVWYEVGKETPREGAPLFMVTENSPEVIRSGCSIGGRFCVVGLPPGFQALENDKVTHFAYINSNMLPKNCKPGCLGSGWRLTKDMLPEDNEPVAIWPSFQGCQFAVWNEDCNCWDTEDGDDYMCDKDAAEKWYPINWGGVQ